MSKLQVGQKIYIPVRHSREASLREETLTKVGRIWAEYGYGRRIDIKALRIERPGHGSLGERVYLSREEWETANAIREAWRELRQAVSHMPPAHLTLDEIQSIIAKLKGPSE